MFRTLPVIAACLALFSLNACATRPDEQPPAPKLAFAPEVPSSQLTTFPSLGRGLAGRTIRVSGEGDLVLARNEVVLTFDDGPVPGKTPAILKALDAHGVKATFLMVGQMARSYPALVREVAARGHTIGTHTQGHANLAAAGFDRAVEQIDQGRASISAALVPTGFRAAPFFRFPYLADTAALRRHLAMKGLVVIDPTVDSKDYFVSSPDQVRSRTIAALQRKGSGIVLFHDIHKRTVDMLPAFLAELKAKGFRVVHLVPGSPRGESVLTAALTR